MQVLTFKDVNVEELAKADLELPDDKPGFSGVTSIGGAMLGLPDGVSACLFDMDGVVTQTAVVHDAAWKEMFDDFLRDRVGIP